MAVQGPPGVAGLTGPVGLQGQKVPLDLELFFFFLKKGIFEIVFAEIENNDDKFTF